MFERFKPKPKVEMSEEELAAHNDAVLEAVKDEIADDPAAQPPEKVEAVVPDAPLHTPMHDDNALVRAAAYKAEHGGVMEGGVLEGDENFKEAA